VSPTAAQNAIVYLQIAKTHSSRFRLRLELANQTAVAEEPTVIAIAFSFLKKAGASAFHLLTNSEGIVLNFCKYIAQ
jgi:hypothetical protein